MTFSATSLFDSPQISTTWNLEHLGSNGRGLGGVGAGGLAFRKPDHLDSIALLIKGTLKSDFLLINLHLTSGQDHDSNHLAAVVIIECSLNYLLKSNQIKKSDRIILGDFNDKPYLPKPDVKLKCFDIMYRYMEKKNYIDLVKGEIQTNRMNDTLRRIIGRILVNSSAKRHHVDTL